ncbi:hypothetical protein [Amycolatopsis sp. PS_44_ISF1]|uniref:hypothetical protein n=1 Tax=Amycolatopsis sp. PS_44_ISF1 TaxID=2974917 RepID=UPI0028DEE3FA|nr:hypothetical protein [Amycolatopsis sp. PS_44_ISF1]MDT8910639.1 hypothetical protein [Amycolatopsis sp. PS_44_ISF1]MDT8916271.1 hypothetical protein [Amycolatopsis sp. PS_44_ISF1]
MGTVGTTGPTAELPPRYGLLSGAGADSLERERAALDQATGTGPSSSSYPAVEGAGNYSPGNTGTGSFGGSGSPSGSGSFSGPGGSSSPGSFGGSGNFSGPGGFSGSGGSGGFGDSGSLSGPGGSSSSGGFAGSGAPSGYGGGSGFAPHPGSHPGPGHPASTPQPSPAAATIHQTPGSAPLPVHWVLLLALLLGLAAGSVIGLLTLI